MDYGHEKAESILSDMELEIKDIYSQASNSAQKKAETYFEKFKAKDAVLSEQVKKGEMTEDDYKKWRINKLTTGARYKALEEGLASDLTGADKLAASVINGHLPDVYATNYNWGTYEIESNARIDTNFMIYDRQTVERLLREKPDLLPMKAAVSIPEDLRWNKKNINNAITQGILLGDSIPDMAKRLAAVTDMNRKSAVRNARTMTTSAENGGRVDSYKRAVDMGINITQKWLATKDNRTRHEHAMLDGQEVEVGKPFKVEGYEIMFPADPTAEPFLVYNCRCTLISKFKGFDHKKMDEYTEQKPLSYKEWEEEHKKATEKKPHVPQSDRPPTKEGWLYKTGYTFTEKTGTVLPEMNEMIETADEDIQKVWKKYAERMDYAKPPLKSQSSANAYYHPEENRVHLREEEVRENRAGEPKYQVFFHEYGHNIDYICDGYRRNKGAFSEFWKNENGQHLQDIIMSEWKRKFTPEISTTDVARKMFAEQLKEGGLGAETFSKTALAEWRKRNHISRDDSLYTKMKDELRSCETQGQYFEFYKKYASNFVTESDIDKYRVVNKDEVKSYIKDMRKKYTLEQRSDLSDMFETFTVQEIDIEYPLGRGHGKNYTKRQNALSKEAFAEMLSAEIANRESLELIKQELPETYAAFRQMLKEIM